MASIIEELSEEDQQLKSELDMLVERLQVWAWRCTSVWPQLLICSLLGAGYYSVQARP